MAQSPALEEPTYSQGDRWEYQVEGRIVAMGGLTNFSGEVLATGLTVAKVEATEGDMTTISWESEFSISGNLSLPNGGENGEASFQGSIEVDREEDLRMPYLLPVYIRDTTTLDLSVDVGFFLEYGATFATESSVTPTSSYPSFPLEEGERSVVFTTHVASNLSVSFLGATITNDSVDDVDSTLTMSVGPLEEVVVPAGTYQALKVRTLIVEGVAPVPFQLLFPGTEQVAYYSGEVGNMVLFQLFANGTEIGTAALRSFSLASQPPFWQQPVFLGLLLAVPVAILLFLYWRERRKGI